MKFSKFALMFLAVIITLTSVTGCSLFKRDNRMRAKLLMVSGNYLDSRLICELAQYKSKQPMILVSPTDSGDYEIFFAPSTGAKTEQIAKENFSEFLTFINARNIVIMGGSKYVPQELIDIINANQNNVTQLTNDNWEKNAYTLGQMLNQDRLVRLYREYRAKYDEVNGIK